MARGRAELLMVMVHEEEVPANYATLPVTFWVTYKDVFGKDLETRIQVMLASCGSCHRSRTTAPRGPMSARQR